MSVTTTPAGNCDRQRRRHDKLLERRRLACSPYRAARAIASARPASGKSTATRTQGTVCESAGLSGRIPHDFRRTAVRNLERASLSRSVAMRMTGHKSEAVYRQYAIVSEQDLHEAALKLARVEQQGKVLGKVAVVRE